MGYVSKETITAGVTSSLLSAEARKEAKEREKNEPVVRVVTQKNIKQGNPVIKNRLVMEPEACLISEGEYPKEVKCVQEVYYEQWEYTYKIEQHWERKNGKETGVLLRNETKEINRQRLEDYKP